MCEGNFDQKQNGEGDAEKNPIDTFYRQRAIERAGTEIDGDGADDTDRIKTGERGEIRVVMITMTGKPTAMRNGIAERRGDLTD